MDRPKAWFCLESIYILNKTKILKKPSSCLPLLCLTLNSMHIADDINMIFKEGFYNLLTRFLKHQ